MRFRKFLKPYKTRGSSFRENTYRIGIKNKETGDMTSMTGTGILNHEFKISESGTYTAFVENNNNLPIKVTGAAVYK